MRNCRLLNNDTCAWTPNRVSMQSVLCNLCCGESIVVEIVFPPLPVTFPKSRFTGPRQVGGNQAATSGNFQKKQNSWLGKSFVCKSLLGKWTATRRQPAGTSRKNESQGQLVANEVRTPQVQALFGEQMFFPKRSLTVGVLTVLYLKGARGWWLVQRLVFN